MFPMALRFVTVKYTLRKILTPCCFVILFTFHGIQMLIDVLMMFRLTLDVLMMFRFKKICTVKAI